MPPLTPDERAAAETRLREVQARDREQHEQLLRDAQAAYKAVDWHSVDGPEGWAKTFEEARQQYHSGRFLIERLGAERVLDPLLMATLLGLRQTLVAELRTPTAAEQMLVDLAMLGYYNALRVQGWIGSLALHIEHELFGQAAPAVTLRGQFGPAIEGFAVEERLKKLHEGLLPLFDRSNRMVVRTLEAIRRGRQAPTPAVTVGQAGQVNLGHQQVNAVGTD